MNYWPYGLPYHHGVTVYYDIIIANVEYNKIKKGKF